jgi:hypothetical protein
MTGVPVGVQFQSQTMLPEGTFTHPWVPLLAP